MEGVGALIGCREGGRAGLGGSTDARTLNQAPILGECVNPNGLLKGSRSAQQRAGLNPEPYTPGRNPQRERQVGGPAMVRGLKFEGRGLMLQC